MKFIFYFLWENNIIFRISNGKKYPETDRRNRIRRIRSANPNAPSIFRGEFNWNFTKAHSHITRLSNIRETIKKKPTLKASKSKLNIDRGRRELWPAKNYSVTQTRKFISFRIKLTTCMDFRSYKIRPCSMSLPSGCVNVSESTMKAFLSQCFIDESGISIGSIKWSARIDRLMQCAYVLFISWCNMSNMTIYFIYYIIYISY